MLNEVLSAYQKEYSKKELLGLVEYFKGGL
jgi:hypothetical protein